MVQWLRLHAPTTAQDRERGNQKKCRWGAGVGSSEQSQRIWNASEIQLGERVGVGGEYSLNKGVNMRVLDSSVKSG